MLNLPSPEQVRQRRKQRNTAATRRKHYADRVAAATTKRQQLVEAFDYLRATVAGLPRDRFEEEADRVIRDLFGTADRLGGLT